MTVSMMFTLGRGNPYIELLSQSLADNGCEVRPYRLSSLLLSRIDVLHLHWPESVLKGNLGKAVLGFLKVFAVLTVARLKGVSTMWTVHNLGNHEPRHPRLEQVFLRLLSRSVDGWISLSRDAVAVASRALPGRLDKPVFVIPHGHYRDAYPALTSQRQAREALQVPIDADVFLFFGQIRPYKNVPELIRAFERFDDPNAVLIVAGQYKARQKPDASTFGSNDSRVKVKLDRIPDDDVPLFFAAADLCVLPFAGVLNSGSAILALSMNTPVLVPEDGPFDELRRQAGKAWVGTYQGELTPHVLQTNMKRVQDLHGRPNLASMEWGDIGRATAEAYESLIRQQRVT